MEEEFQYLQIGVGHKEQTGDRLINAAGFRNYILNPSAIRGTNGTSATNATILADTGSPNISEESFPGYIMTVTSAGGFVDFSTSGMTSDNMGGLQCEAAGSVRGFQST